MSEMKRISRKKFCKMTGVSETDPIISVWLGGNFLMPAFGVSYLVYKNDIFEKYYVKLRNGTLWRLTFIRDSDKPGVIHKFVPDTSNRFGGRYNFYKVWKRG